MALVERRKNFGVRDCRGRDSLCVRRYTHFSEFPSFRAGLCSLRRRLHCPLGAVGLGNRSKDPGLIRLDWVCDMLAGSVRDALGASSSIISH